MTMRKRRRRSGRLSRASQRPRFRLRPRSSWKVRSLHAFRHIAHTSGPVGAANGPRHIPYGCPQLRDCVLRGKRVMPAACRDRGGGLRLQHEPALLPAPHGLRPVQPLGHRAGVQRAHGVHRAPPRSLMQSTLAAESGAIRLHHRYTLCCSLEASTTVIMRRYKFWQGVQRVCRRCRDCKAAP